MSSVRTRTTRFERWLRPGALKRTTGDFSPASVTPAPTRVQWRHAFFVALAAPTLAAAQPLQRLRGNVPEVTKRLAPLGSLPANTPIDLIIGLPLRNVGLLDSLVRDI